MENMNGREVWPETEETPEDFSEEEAAEFALRGVRRLGGVEDVEGTEDVEDKDDLVAEFEAIDEGSPEYTDSAENIVEYKPWEEYEDYEDFGDDAEDEEYAEEEEWDEGDERAEELEREKQFEVLTIPREILKEYDLPKLPDGVAIMGGTARSVARRIITGDVEPVRDLDLVYVPELGDADAKLTDEDLDELSKEYMPDDYMYGHGIQTEKLENYFSTRDFTLNQCLVCQNKLMVTRAAYDDLQENIIRPSYDTQPNTETPISERLFLKALMLKAVLTSVTSSYLVLEEFGLGWIDEKIEEEAYEGEDLRLGVFDIALTMNKAMSRGAEVAREFVETLAEYGVVDEYYRGQPLLLARAAHDGCYNFEYRPYDDWSDEESYDSLEDEFAELKEYQTGDRAVRKAMREYESKNKTDAQITERTIGKYTPEEYDFVNRAS